LHDDSSFVGKIAFGVKNVNPERISGGKKEHIMNN
jgi:hypothetical protein